MESTPMRKDMTMMAPEWSPTCSGSTSSKQVFDRRPPQLQYVDATSGGRRSSTSYAVHASPSHTQPAASSVHPLVPLLSYSHTHLTPSSLYSHLIRTTVAPAGNAPLASLAYQSNSATSGREQVKKPLNAFMLYMKEMRHQVLLEGQQRESAAINRILGRRWHALSHSEQSKYYELANKERQLHMQLFPGWSAKDNYGKRKRKRQ